MTSALSRVFLLAQEVSAMCQARVFLVEGDREEEIMRDVVGIEIRPEGVLLKSFFDEPKTVAGEIYEIDFLKHRVLIRPKRGKDE